jgi:hypothetical protein
MADRSGRRDLNPRPLAPEASARTVLRYFPVYCVEMNGIEPMTVRLRAGCSTWLSYIPKGRSFR